MILLIVQLVCAVIQILLLVVQVKVYNVLSQCLELQREGKIYSRVKTSEELYGWIESRDITAIQSNSRSGEEHIRVITKKGAVLVEIRDIEILQAVKSTAKVVLGNL